MLSADDVRLVQLGLEIGDFEHLLCLLRQWDVSDRQRSAHRTHRILDRALELPELNAEIAQNLNTDTLALADNPEEQVLGANVIVSETQCFLPAKADHILYSVGKVAFHGR